jgi:hypothetical protein
MKFVLLVVLAGCTIGPTASPSPDPQSPDTTVAAATSCSKLGPHVNGWNADAQRIALACPPLVKFIGAGGVPIGAIGAVKAACPQTRVVLRMYTGDRYNGDPYADATQFWQTTFAPVRALPAYQRQWIDYLEGPNEQDSTPTWPMVPGYRPGYFNAFLEQFVAHVRAAGFRPVVGSISVGNPGGDLDAEAVPALREILPAIQAAAEAGGGWSYHAYTNNASQDEAGEQYMSLRYRAYLERIPELRGIPLLLTEGGFDLGGNPDADGWRQHLSPEAYIEWLRWFDSELGRDGEVVGVTLFSVGAGWPSFDLGPVSGALRDQVLACQPSCACIGDVDNFCLYGPTDGCAMTQPGGYCDPDGDGDFSDADWVRGYYDHSDQCN